MKKFRVWILSVFTAVLASTIGASVQKYTKNISWGKAFLTVWKWTLHVLTFGIPLWIVILLTIAVIFIISVVSRIVEARVPATIDEYRSDIIQGVKWFWEYEKQPDGKWVVTPYSLRAHCPKCMGLLIERYRSPHSPVHDSLHCENCRYAKDCDPSVSQLTERVHREVFRRVFTGEWKKDQTHQRDGDAVQV